MEEGQVLCLDSIIQQFTQTNDDFLIATVGKMALVDINLDFLVTLCPAGQGMLHRVVQKLINKREAV